MVLSGLLSRFGVKPATIRVAPKIVGTGSTAKGYKRGALLKALNEIEQADHARVLEPVLATGVSGNNDAPENPLENGERPVKPSLADPDPQPIKRSGDGLDYRTMLIDLLDQVEKLGPRLPIELHLKCKQFRTTMGLPPNVVSDPNWNSKEEEEDLPRESDEWNSVGRWETTGEGTDLPEPDGIEY